MLIWVILIGVVNAALLVFLITKKPAKTDDGAAQMLKADLTELNKGVLELKDSLNEKIGEKLDKSQKHMSESIQRQFEQSAKIITDISGRLTKLDETNKRVVDVADELK